MDVVLGLDLVVFMYVLFEDGDGFLVILEDEILVVLVDVEELVEKLHFLFFGKINVLFF